MPYDRDAANYAEDSEELEVGSEGEPSLIAEYLKRARTIYHARVVWFFNQAKYQNMRRGILDETDSPWEGSSNPHVPIVDQFVRSMKSTYLEVSSIEPPVLIDPLDERMSMDTAKKLEAYLTDVYMNRMKVRRPVNSLVDSMLEVGTGFLKIGYEKHYDMREEILDLDKMSPQDEDLIRLFSDDVGMFFAVAFKMDLENEDDASEIRKAVQQFKAGKRVISFRHRVAIKDQPVWIPVKNHDVLRHWTAPAEIQQHRFFIHRFFQSRGEIREKVRSGYYDKAAEEQIMRAGHRQRYAKGLELEIELSDRQQQGIVTDLYGTNAAGIMGEDSDIETYEVNTYYSQDPERIPERKAVLTFFPVYHDGRFARRVWLNKPMWPWKQFDFDNPAGVTYGGRGIGQMIETVQLEANQIHKAKLDMFPWLTGLTGRYDPDLMIQQNDAAITVGPGQLIPARQGAIELFTPANSTVPFEREEQILIGYAENLLGPQQSVLGRSGKIGSNRTATEIGAVEALSGKLITMDVENFQDAMADVHLMTIWEIIENMPDEVRFARQDGNGGVFFDTLRRSDIDGMLFKIRPHGNIQNSNAALETQRIQNRILFLGQLAQLGVQVNWPELAKRWLIRDGERTPEKLIMTPAQSQPAPSEPTGGPINAILQATKRGKTKETEEPSRERISQYVPLQHPGRPAFSEGSNFMASPGY